MSDSEDFSDQLDFLREAKDVIEDLSVYSVTKASLQPDVLEWVDTVSQMAAEYLASKGVGFSEDQAMGFLFVRHLQK